MAISIKAQIYIDKILEGEHSIAEWLQIEKELTAIENELSEEDHQAIAESGAGEMLYMICSAFK